MLEIALLRNHTQEVVARLNKKGYKEAEATVNQILDLDEQRRKLQTTADATAANLNSISKEVGKLMAKGDKQAAELAKQQTASLKDELKNLEEKQKETMHQLDALLVKLPNLPADIVPVGRTADDNVKIAENNSIPTLPPDALPHWELIKKYNIIDFELGTKITGSGFPVYIGKGAAIQRALIRLFLDKAIEAGYTEVMPPLLVNADSGYGTGQLPDKDGQMYHVTNDGYYLIPTAEVPITNLYRDVILEPNQLPIKNVGYTPCFRREAGSWGADVRGLNRLHQFDKVEIVQITTPENSYQALEQMCKHVESLLDLLELPWRKLLLCGGDMSFTSALTYDYEVFSAAQGRWLEVSSTSNFETFQANRLKLRYRTEAKKTALCHTLNGSAMALPRILAALLENNQKPDGIYLPKALARYANFDKID